MHSAVTPARLCTLFLILIHLLIPSMVSADGVRILAPGDEMIPEPPIAGGLPALEQSAQALEKVSIASANTNIDDLSQLTRREAPFEIVPLASHPDLIWDPVQKTLRGGADVIAAHAEGMDLPAMIDNFAALRFLKKRFGSAPQALALLNTRSLKDTPVLVEVTGISGRALTAFTMSADGSIQMIFPRRAEPREIKQASIVLNVPLKDPSDSVTLIVLSSSQPLEALDQALTDMPHYRASIEALHLILTLAPQELRFGAILLSP